MKGQWKLRLRLWLVMILMFALVNMIFTVVGYYLGIRSIGLYFILSLFVLFLQYWFGGKIVEKSMGVRYLSEAEAPHIHKMVEELANEAGIPKPKVGMCNSMVPNAFAYGRSKRDGHVCVTRGILGLLDREELKAVLGHEISHINHNDMAITTIVSAIPLVLYYFAVSSLYSGSGGDDNNYGFAIAIFAFLAYFLSQLLVLFVSRIREYYADAGSVELGCKPEKLASALYKLVYGAASAPKDEIKDIEGSKAFFLNDVSNAANQISELSQLDLDNDGSISQEELYNLKNQKVNINTGSKIMELLSTHPDMLKRIKRLADNS